MFSASLPPMRVPLEVNSMASEEPAKRNETLTSWVQRNRINSTTLLNALDDLGATEVIDLQDLADNDISQFQPPFLKKLEYVRFKRGILSLKVSAGVADEQELKNIATDSTGAFTLPIASSSIRSIITSSPVDELYEGNQNKSPPLPSACQGEGCIGTLSSHLGTRKNKYLTGLDGPDFRWIVTCSDCSRKWHACHFLCGHLQKISSMGSSDIIRHEQGRFNRWQKKIKPPCSKNPRRSVLKAGYAEQKKNLKARVPEEGKNVSTVPVHRINATMTSSMSTETSSINPNHPQFDNEFRSMLGSLNEDTLNFSGTEEADRMDEEFLGGCSDDELSPTIGSTNASPNNSRIEVEEPANKRIKVTTTTCMDNKESDICIDKLCEEVTAKCIVQLLSEKITNRK